MRSCAVLESEVQERLPGLFLTLYQGCRRLGVGFSVTYEESCEQWYVTINSCAPGEEWIGKSRSGPDIAIECALEWLDTLEDMAREHKIKKPQREEP